MLVEWKSSEGTAPGMKKTAKTTTTWADPYVENLLENISEGKRVLNPRKVRSFSPRAIRPTLFSLFRAAKREDYRGVSSGKGSRHRRDWALAASSVKVRWSDNLSESARQRSWRHPAYSGLKNYLCCRRFTNKLNCLKNSSRRYSSAISILKRICAISSSTTAKNDWPVFC